MTRAEILWLTAGLWFLVSAAGYWMADADPKNYRQLGWLWYITVQLIQLVFIVLGWFLLMPFCLAHTWKFGVHPSIKDGKRTIDVWKWEPLNWVYGNPEDGVSGQWALIGPTASDSYMPLPPFALRMFWAHIYVWGYTAWRAYCWSALRNSCDQLKYIFAWPNGPFVEFTVFGHKFHAGWQTENGYNVPVLG